MEYNKELEDTILYHLERIVEFSTYIQVAVENGLHLSEYYDEVEHFDKISYN